MQCSHLPQLRKSKHIFYGICLSLAPNLHVPLIGDVSCLATKQSGPDCCHDNMAGVSSSWRE